MVANWNCPKCGIASTSRRANPRQEGCGEIRTFKRYAAKQHRKDWTCTTCGLHVFPTAGTTFQKSSTDLGKWFYAMYLMTSTRCTISGKQLARELGVPYNTARRMRRAIRHELMA